MRKFSLLSYFLIDDFYKHLEIKKELLNLIEQEKLESLSNSDSISKLDWSQKHNENREWVKLVLPFLQCQLDVMARGVGFKYTKFHELWFQQYNKNDIHNWHAHGSNFTCVYYLELDENSPKTELIEPFSNKKFCPDIKEGSIIVFPSYVMHRAPKIENEVRKTIISFNVDFEEITEELVELL